MDFDLAAKQVYTEYYEKIMNGLRLYTMAVGEEETVYKYFFYCRVVG